MMNKGMRNLARGSTEESSTLGVVEELLVQEEQFKELVLKPAMDALR